MKQYFIDHPSMQIVLALLFMALFFVIVYFWNNAENIKESNLLKQRMIAAFKNDVIDLDLDLFTPLTKEFLQHKSLQEISNINRFLFEKTYEELSFLHTNLFEEIADYNYERIGGEIGNENIIFIGKDFFDKKAVDDNDILCIEKRTRNLVVHRVTYQVVIHLKNSDKILFATYPDNIYNPGIWTKDFNLEKVIEMQQTQKEEAIKQQLINQLT